MRHEGGVPGVEGRGRGRGSDAQWPGSSQWGILQLLCSWAEAAIWLAAGESEDPEREHAVGFEDLHCGNRDLYAFC